MGGPACHSPSALLLELGAEEQVREQEDVAQLAGPLHQLHHEAVFQQLPVLWGRAAARVSSRLARGAFIASTSNPQTHFPVGSLHRIGL